MTELVVELVQYVEELIIAFMIIREDSECFNHNLKWYEHIIQEMEVMVCWRTGNGLDWLENAMSALYKSEYPVNPEKCWFLTCRMPLG
jgi:hypothetical protein